jgi:hypothetical protein
VKLRAVGLLLVLWCALAIAPALIIALLLRVDTTDPSPAVLVIWLAGYLAQIAIFTVITARTSRANFVGWAIAAVVPWTANWAAPISPWWLVACAAVVTGYSWWLYRSLTRGQSLRPTA